MASTATPRRAPSRKRSRPAAATKQAAGTGRKAAKAAKAVRKPSIARLARAAAAKAAKAVGRRAMHAGAEAIRAAADRAASTGREAVESGLSRRLPIQVSVDVAVPPRVAWDEWMKFESIHEGVHRIEDVERDGDTLYGNTAGPRSTEWEAEISDERECESFAWRSVEGSDCAGLITFHRLSERLTRIELDLDVVPTNPAEGLVLALHVAHRRAEAELRRFKARVEFISPDTYESAVEGNDQDDAAAGDDGDDEGTEE